MNKHIISTEKAPAAVGTYSQAVAVTGGTTIYLSGQIPLVPETMEVVEGGIEEQIHQVFKNLIAVCEASKGSLSDIVKLNIFLIDLNYPKVLSIIEQQLLIWLLLTVEALSLQMVNKALVFFPKCFELPKKFLY